MNLSIYQALGVTLGKLDALLRLVEMDHIRLSTLHPVDAAPLIGKET